MKSIPQVLKSLFLPLTSCGLIISSCTPRENVGTKQSTQGNKITHPNEVSQKANEYPELSIKISDEDALKIGRLIWRNESGGRREGLVVWNVGEEFPSLGIGHFIWYPAGYRGPFEESFPQLVRFLIARGVDVPEWARGACPWPDRETFLRTQNSPKIEELRSLLERTVADQARFAAERLRGALPKMLEAVEPSRRAHLRSRFEAVYRIPHGIYALMDYVNFKGEGVNLTERYNGEGWGLLQVLELMPDRMPETSSIVIMNDFADAAWMVLERRIQNSPPTRGESRWAAGWRNRCETYRIK